jgi:hypothetical protein
MRSEELDKILNDALSSYSREEPRPGLDDRVFDRIRTEGEHRSFEWLRWVVAIPAFACVLFSALMFLRTRDSLAKSWKPAPIISSAAPLRRIGAGAVQTTVIRRRPKHVGLPKREQFPTPAPLTAEERALLAFAVRSPKQAEKFLADAHTHTTEPLQIKEIQIEPLQDSGE